MDLTGFINDLVGFSNKIDISSRGLATDGEEHEGRINYEDNITAAQGSCIQKQKETLVDQYPT